VYGRQQRGVQQVDAWGTASGYVWDDAVRNDGGKDRCTFLFRHLPTVDETASQLWVLGVTGTASYRLEYKDTTWHNVTISDTVSLAGFDQYRWQAVSLHGKAFFAFNTDVDRLHVWDGTSFRRAGLAEPAAPTSSG
jgi:hypothetical protein